jgi:hypothetical protein
MSVGIYTDGSKLLNDNSRCSMYISTFIEKKISGKLSYTTNTNAKLFLRGLNERCLMQKRKRTFRI